MFRNRRLGAEQSSVVLQQNYSNETDTFITTAALRLLDLQTGPTTDREAIRVNKARYPRDL